MYVPELDPTVRPHSWNPSKRPQIVDTCSSTHSVCLTNMISLVHESHAEREGPLEIQAAPKSCARRPDLIHASFRANVSHCSTKIRNAAKRPDSSCSAPASI